MDAQSANTVERAYELARSGQYATITQIRMQLRREGYSHVDGHTVGLGLRRELTRLMRAGRVTAAAE